jgi:hypothetical protein
VTAVTAGRTMPRPEGQRETLEERLERVCSVCGQKTVEAGICRACGATKQGPTVHVPVASPKKSVTSTSVSQKLAAKPAKNTGVVAAAQRQSATPRTRALVLRGSSRPGRPLWCVGRSVAGRYPAELLRCWAAP